MTSNVRYRPDTGWERRCPDCLRRHVAAWWPLDLEFWNPEKLRVCRACQRLNDAEYARRRLWADPAFKAAEIARHRANRAMHRDTQRTINRLRWQRIKADPEKLARHREAARLATRAYRARRSAA